jgi:nicotinamidase-related amidase
MNKKILVVVDFQNDFIDGSLGTKEAQAIVPNVEQKLNEAVDNDDIIIFTRDTHYYNYGDTQEGRLLPVEHCIKETEGWDLHAVCKDVIKKHNTYIIDKTTFGTTCFYDTIESILNIEDLDNDFEIEIIGLCTDICVVTNALILKTLYPENTIRVLSDCCAGTTKEKHEHALDVMKSCQIEIE